jgi:hypothetical protein
VIADNHFWKKGVDFLEKSVDFLEKVALQIWLAATGYLSAYCVSRFFDGFRGTKHGVRNGGCPRHFGDPRAANKPFLSFFFIFVAFSADVTFFLTTFVASFQQLTANKEK